MKFRIIIFIYVVSLILVPKTYSVELSDFKLPYQNTGSFIVTTGYNTPPTHIKKDSFALDFTQNNCQAYGQPVLAIADGIVRLTKTEAESGGYGFVVDINHNSGLISRYAHLIAGSISVQEGVGVHRGQIIGLIGNTGNVVGAACLSYPGTHLHFAVYQKQADGALIAYKPEPISGYTNLLAGNWYVSDNNIYQSQLAENQSSSSLNSSSSSGENSSKTINGQQVASNQSSSWFDAAKGLVAGAYNKLGQLYSVAKETLFALFGNNSSSQDVIVIDNNSDNNLKNSSGTDGLLPSQNLSYQTNQSTDQAVVDQFTGQENNSQQAELIINPNIQSDVSSSDLLISTSVSPLASTSVSLASSSLQNITSTNNNPILPTELLKCPLDFQAFPTHQIIFNEVNWFGSGTSSGDEWLELKNISSQKIDLTNWQIISKKQHLKINLTELKDHIIQPNKLVILERGDDNSAPQVLADLIYSGSINNSDEAIYIFDNNCRLIDEVEANPNWPAGDKVSLRTMERDFGNLTWHTSSVLGGTPKQENSPLVYFGGGGGTTSNSNNNLNENNQTSDVSPAKILISEIQTTGGAGKTDNDFIELYNPNDFSVNLKGYRLVKRSKDGVTDVGVKSWTVDSVVQSKSYYLWVNNDYSELAGAADVLTASTISDNNGIALRFGEENSGTIIDSVAWGEAQNNFAENESFPNNPGAGQSIQRKISEANFVDTNNNAQDFEIQNCPSPKSQAGSCLEAQANRPPIAFFTYRQPSKVGDSTTFDASSSTDPDFGDNISFYQWDFGDNSNIYSTTSPLISYVYSQSGDYMVNLSVFDSSLASSTYTADVSVLPADEVDKNSTSSIGDGINNINSVLISEIKTGESGDADDEFVEIYNPTDQTINISNWSIERKTSSSSLETKNLVSLFPTSSIAAKSFFLIASESYSGLAVPDLVYSNNSNNLSYSDDVLLLKNANGDIVDQVSYSEIPTGKSLERKSNASSTSQSMESGDNQFLGNGYDSGNDDFDFIIRDNPNPQNSLSFPEPRNKPSSPMPLTSSSSIASYNATSGEIIFNWIPSYDFSGATSTNYYEIFIQDSSSTLDSNASSSVILETTSTTASYLNDKPGLFNFAIQSFDRDGLGSDFAYANLLIEQDASSSTSSDFLISTSSSRFILAQLATSTAYGGGGDSSDPSCQENFTMPVDFSGNLSVSFVLSINDGHRGAGGSVYFSGNNQSYDIGTNQGDASLPPQIVTIDLGRVNLQKGQSYFFRITPGHREIQGYGWIFHNFMVWGSTSTDSSFSFSPELANLKNIYFYLWGENELSPAYVAPTLSASASFSWEEEKYIKQLDKSVSINQGNTRTYSDPAFGSSIAQEIFISPVNLTGKLKLTLYGIAGGGVSAGPGSTNPSLWFSATGQTYPLKENWNSSEDIVVDIGTTTINKGQTYTFRFNRGYLGDLTGGYYSEFALYGSTSSQNYPNYFRMEKKRQSWTTISSMSNLYFILEKINQVSTSTTTSTETASTPKTASTSTVDNSLDDLNNADSTISYYPNSASSTASSTQSYVSTSTDLTGDSTSSTSTLIDTSTEVDSSSSSVIFASSTLDISTTSHPSKVEPDY